MFLKQQQHVGDCWSFIENNRVHLFYLTCPDTVERHTCWTISHASTTDFKQWLDHPDVLHSDPSNPRLSCLSTGSVVHYKNRYWLCFCGNHNSPSPGLSFVWSDDLNVWHLLENHRAIEIDGSIYTRRGSEPFNNPRWRDPFLFVHDDALYALVCAAVEEDFPLADGCVAVLRTEDLEHWEYLPPLKLPRLGTDLECPKLHQVDGKWHLVVSLFDILQAPELRSRLPENLNPNTSYLLTADDWHGPYTLHGNGRLYADDPPGYPYANEVFNWKGAWYAIGTCWSDRRPDSISSPVDLAWGRAEPRDHDRCSNNPRNRRSS